MIKAVLFDVDGLVITGEEGYFSERYANEYGVPAEEVAEFFSGDFRECTFGKADLKDKIEPHLKKWGWEGTVDDFLDYWFKRESEINEKVLAIVKHLRANGMGCYIATRQEKYRARYFWEEMGLQEHFDGMFCTCDIGSDKNEAAFWDEVTSKLGLEPQEMLFFDDSQKNVDFAREYGVNSHLYTGFDVLERETKSLL